MAIPPSKISTKLKEMQISYNLFRAQHRQKIHTNYLVLHVGFPFTLLRQWFPQVSSEIRGMVHGSFCNSRLVLWEYFTLFPEMSAFLVQNSRGRAGGPRSPGTGLVDSWRALSGPCSLGNNSSPFCSFRLLLKGHQVCRNLLFLTLAGCTQVFKPQHCIHSVASLKLV